MSRCEIFHKTLKSKKDLHRLIQFSDFHYRSGLEQMTGILLTDKNAINGKVPIQLSKELSKNYDAFVEIGNNRCPRFQVHSMHSSQRVGPDNVILNQVLITLTQTCCIEQKNLKIDHPRRFVPFQSGCTLIIDMDKFTVKIMKKRTDNVERLEGFLTRFSMTELNYSDSPFNAPLVLQKDEEPFVILHGIS